MLRVSVPPDVQDTLRLALKKAGSRECGGVLLGEHVGHNYFTVRSITVQRAGAIASFIRAIKGAVAAIRAFCTSKAENYTRFNYLGEWHSHPLFSTEPSGTDHESMRSIVMDKCVGANFVVMLIFRLEGTKLEGSAHTYLPDGTIVRSMLELEGST